MDSLVTIDNIFQHLSQDHRLHSSHISLYFALLVLRQQSLFANPFIINRKKLMSLSKIGSNATYHRCIKQLQEFGYIQYMPNFNSYIGTTVYFEDTAEWLDLFELASVKARHLL